MKTVDWSNKVATDFRARIIIEPDSPILAFKANRNRYTRQIQPSYKGLPYLGSQDSEDALTWNVFRSLQKALYQVAKPDVCIVFHFSLRSALNSLFSTYASRRSQLCHSLASST